MHEHDSSNERPALQHLGVVAKAKSPYLESELQRLATYLEGRGIQVSCNHKAADALSRLQPQIRELEEIPRHSDLIVVLGGDGTLLSIARESARSGTPIFGVNYGRMGFLTSTTRAELFASLDRILAGSYTLSQRQMLRASLPGRAEPLVRDVLNDAVINKTSLARIIQVEVKVDGEFVSHVRADGLIVATATGSTAYSLAAGGPIVMPGVAAILLTPISPHMLTNRPLVLPATARIELSVPNADQDIVLTLDGQEGVPLGPAEVVQVEHSPYSCSLVQPLPRSYFEVLRNKLHWGSR